VGLISNPRSRRNRRDPALLARLERILAPLGDGAVVHGDGGLDGLAELARTWRDAGVTTLALNGGDGTTHHVLTHILGAWAGPPWPEVLLLRGGTMNTAANGLGLPRGSPESLLQAWVEARLQHRELPRQERCPLRIEADDRPPLFGFMWGNGLFAGFLGIFYDDPDPGPVTAAVTLARVVGASVTGGAIAERAFPSLHHRVTVDGVQWSDHARLAVSAATVPQIGLGFRPWFRAEDPEFLHVLGLACRPPALVRQLPRLYRGLPPTDPRIEDQAARELLVEAQSPWAFIVDGDYHPPARRVRVTLGPRLRFPLPSPSGD
jgi:diacylglycerol kinase family enzyme